MSSMGFDEGDIDLGLDYDYDDDYVVCWGWRPPPPTTKKKLWVTDCDYDYVGIDPLYCSSSCTVLTYLIYIDSKYLTLLSIRSRCL